MLRHAQMLARCLALAGAGSGLGGTVAEAFRQQPTLSCSVSDHNLLLDLVLRLAPGGAADPAGMEGELQIHHPKLSHDRRRWPLDKRQPANLWLNGNELKLKLVLGASERLVVLVIETQRRTASDDAYAGTWTLATAETPRLSGRVACGVMEP